MNTYYEQQMEVISRKLAILKQQINNYKINIEREKEQISNLKAQIGKLIQQKENLKIDR